MDSQTLSGILQPTLAGPAPLQPGSLPINSTMSQDNMMVSSSGISNSLRQMHVTNPLLGQTAMTNNSIG